jgi:hypothetical protein
MTNEYVSWDLDCQVERSAKMGISVFYLYQLINPQHHIHWSDGYHWNIRAKKNLLRLILQKSVKGRSSTLEE